MVVNADLGAVITGLTPTLNLVCHLASVLQFVSVVHLQQRLCNIWVLWAVEVQHLGSQAVVVGPHLMQVHHLGIGVEHGPPALFVHFRQLHRQHPPLPLVQTLGEPQRQLHLCTLR